VRIRCLFEKPFSKNCNWAALLNFISRLFISICYRQVPRNLSIGFGGSVLIRDGGIYLLHGEDTADEETA